MSAAADTIPKELLYGGIALSSTVSIEAGAISGSAVYIGNGLLLTAAHVVDHMKQGETLFFMNRRMIGSAAIKAHAVSFSPGYNDLALIRINDAAAISVEHNGLLPARLCQNDRPVQHAYLGAHGALVGIAKAVKGARNVLHAAVSPGDSGGAVIDASRNCLAGIISYGEFLDSSNFIKQNQEAVKSGLGRFQSSPYVRMVYTPASHISEFLKDAGVN
ncbi:trypsin-like serine peptidase [Azospirillum sp. A29]|uniref:trypsin-like serine peptidase n=1 Tax=unclassified Azospirillum TaxID=2630922 RepID=UPI00366CED4A